MNHLRKRVLLVTLVFSLTACAHIEEDEQNQPVIVAPSAATTTPEYHGDGSIPAHRSVIRMSDGQNDWEIEIPETDRGYEVRVPLRHQRQIRADHQALTPADQQLIDHLRLTDDDYEREGSYVDDESIVDRRAREQRDAGADARPDDRGRSGAEPAPTRPSYLRGLDQVQRLYESGHYEQAMLVLSDLEQAYPNDERILSMKGSLWLELGFEGLARESWERVLRINPDNQPVERALQRLDGVDDDDVIDEDAALEELEEQID